VFDALHFLQVWDLFLKKYKISIFNFFLKNYNVSPIIKF
jgi:hypothetical protein